MKKDNGLYRLVYEYYEARILLGCYTCGDKLPSIPKISDIFHLAPTTIRSALSMLEQEKLIKVDARKAAVVTYDLSPGQMKKNAAEYFIPRREGILGISQSGSYLLEPLWKEGLRKWDDNDRESLRRGIMDPSLNMVSIPVEFYLLAVGALDNRLAMNLLWETVRYLRFPYLTNGMETLTGRKELAGFSREETIEALRAEAAHSYGRSLQALFAFMDEMSLDPGLKDAAPIPFHWNIYRQRPQLRYSFASLLIRKILKGTYPQGTYLPSLPQLVDRYGIPLMTVRRTLGLLEELGMTRSYHGKGTLVCMEPADIDLSRSSIREGIRLYVESLQLLHLTVQNIFLCTWESADPAKRAALIRHFLFLQSEEKSYLCFEACLTFIEDHCPLSTVRECYGSIKVLMVWKYPLILSRLKNRSLHAEYRDCVSRLTSFLQEERPEMFSSELKHLWEQEEQQVRAFLS